MSFLDAFITIKQEEKIKQTQTPEVQSIQTPISPAPQIILNGGVVDPTFLDHFKKVMDDNNLPGTDYYEFKQAFDGSAELADTITEVNRMKMVFKTLASSGLTKENLLSSIQAYKKFLADDNAKFSAALDGKKQNEIVSRQNKIQQLTDSNKSKNEQISQLQKDIQDNIGTINQLGNEISAQQGTLDVKQQNFNVTYNAFVGQLDSDSQKIIANL